MTLTVKKSRSIRIENEEFRFQVSTTPIDEKWNFTLNVTIQRWNPPRGILKVKGLVTRNQWLDISDGTKLDIEDYPVILPRHIATLIQSAKLKGWNSESRSDTFVFTVDNNWVFKV
ncbi:MAG: hypothetical protein Q3M24_18475 [Candidatus Electrothrix aestuarii]|uniref:Uncharacterized protein n=1 Tax=Candidatus Electrothrix aestuarii TaxID=3062594 RepID=A0AAU8LTR1_9BACT|nr:hypothetical protein [Candidatus Electrothrix aestuarii]